MPQPDVDLLADIVASAIKAAQGPLLARIAALEKTAPDAEAIALTAASLIPVPKDGRDGADVDPDSIAQAVKAATDPLLVKIADLETRPYATQGLWDALTATIEKAQERLAVLETNAPKDGKDAPAVDVGAIVKQVLESIPRPVDGDDGEDGKDADPEVIRAEVTKALAGLPKPLDGKDGEKGADGQSVSMDQVEARIVAAVNKAVSEIQTPKDGRDGAKGADGAGIVGASISQMGELIITMTDGSMKTVGVVVGKEGRSGRDGQIGQTGEKGIDGRDGIDGLGFDDIQVEHDGERGFTFKFLRGERVKTFGTFTLPIVLDRGVFEVSKTYVKGDGVSWGGSFFIAQRTTTAKPETSNDWRLAIKRGRDGKGGPGPKGDKGDQGPQGPAGQWGG